MDGGGGGIPCSPALKMTPNSTSLSVVKEWETNIYLLPITCQGDSKAWQLIAEALEAQCLGLNPDSTT